MIVAMRISKEMHRGNIVEICNCFGQTRDAYYKYKHRQSKQIEVFEKIIDMVKERRVDQPREGGRKLHKALKEKFQHDGLKVGRDKLFKILFIYGMLVKRKRSGVRTTNSYHHFHKHKNLIKNLIITKPNQVWVSDITYIRLVNGFCYLALITDVYSRKIVGYDVSNSLELAGCLRAFKQAQRLARPAPGLIHHSDKGSQYCCNEYVNLLKKHHVKISMTEENNCYENAMAERVNGILKDEFYLDQSFEKLKLACGACENAIKIYNNKRLHLSLDYKTPEEVFKNRA
jgi:transposase InsO family protein